MIPVILQSIIKGRTRRRLLLAFYEEIKDNLESYYVMFQIGKLRFFKLEGWEQAMAFPHGEWDSAVVHYAERLREYLRALKEFKEYEDWYASDINNKSQETGRVLHGKREAAQAKFEGLEPVIKAALSSVEGQLKTMKILK